MTEADLLYHQREIINFVWNLVQWWASISFGLIAVAHLAARKLNIFLLIIINIIYISTSFLVFLVVATNLQMEQGVQSDLILLQSENTLSTIAKVSLKGVGPISGFLAPFTEIVTFLGCVAYLNLSYIKTHSKNAKTHNKPLKNDAASGAS